jgi:hypothetical protein
VFNSGISAPPFNLAQPSLVIFLAFSGVVWTYLKQEAAEHVYYLDMNLESLKLSGWFGPLPRTIKF